MGRFLDDFGSILGDSGDHLGMIWASSGGSQACLGLEKETYINFQKIDFLVIGGACAEKNRKVRCLVPVQK